MTEHQAVGHASFYFSSALIYAGTGYTLSNVRNFHRRFKPQTYNGYIHNFNASNSLHPRSC